MVSTLMEYFNKQPRIGTISTCSKDGKVDSAVFGSPHMTDEKTVILGSGGNRTLANLRENPHAVYLIMEPGQSIMDWKGIRVYLQVKEIASSGPLLETFKKNMAKVAGDQAAAMIHAVVSFEINEVRGKVLCPRGKTPWSRGTFHLRLENVVHEALLEKDVVLRDLRPGTERDVLIRGTEITLGELRALTSYQLSLTALQP